MRLFIFTIFFTGTCLVAFSKPVSLQHASIAGKNFLLNKISTSQADKKELELTLVYQTTATTSSAAPNTSAQTIYYIFNSKNGFVVISGDDAAKPVLAYSLEGTFNPGNISPEAAYWLNGYQQQIQYLIDNNVQSTNENTAAWVSITKGADKKQQFTTSVAPLLSTTWDQEPYYNALCPYDSKNSQSTVTGCVATAMAQVMKFWNYPTTGSGFYSYQDPHYGTQSANFGNTTYNWSSMPNKLTGSNTAVATLMYHCGVSVNMTYGIASTGGSSAYVISSASKTTNCAEYALKSYFGYKNTLQGLSRSDYSDANWIAMLEKELDAGRPVVYAGFGNEGGHCFDLDGYDGNNNFHVNWGWSGQDNGYFSINAMSPGTLGTGGGDGGFNSNQQALFGIQAPTNNTSASSMSLYDYVNVSASSIYYGSSFSVTTNLHNTGSATFNGDYCAAIFDNTNAFFDYVQILSSESLASNYTYTSDLTFTYSGSYSMLPGTYSIYIFYRPTGGDWKIVTNAGSYTNYASLSVVNPGTIEMYSNMNVSPGTTLTQNKNISVNLDIINTSSTTFSGNYDVSLYNLDGTHAFTIQTITGETLPYNYHYTGGLTFSNSDLNVSPGTYLLALQCLATGNSNYSLVGSTNYPNPIKVVVQAAALNPDIYEPNNTISTAYNLPVYFSGNSASVGTPGSNCHTGTDYDYYKIYLPTGSNYNISGMINDEEGSGNGNTYTLNGEFSYSTDGGTNWYGPFEGALPANISVPNGGTVYFLVSPVFSGQTGTYELDLSVSKSNAGISNQVTGDEIISIFPNPAKDEISIDLSSVKTEVRNVSLTDMEGKLVYLSSFAYIPGIIKVPVNSLKNGIYMVQVQTINGIIRSKVAIEK